LIIDDSELSDLESELETDGKRAGFNNVIKLSKRPDK